MDFRPVIAAMHRLELLRKIRTRGILRGCGLYPGQPPMLQYIDEHPSCTQREAATQLDITPASAAASLKRLEKAGLLERQPDRHDSRCNRLTVTKEGEEKLRETQRAFEKLDQRMVTGLTEDEIAAFRRICEKMFDNLADESCRHLNVCQLARRAQDDKEDSRA